MAQTAERICDKFTRKTSLVEASFARRSWNVKVKSQRSRSPGTKSALCIHNTPQYGRNGTPSLQITSPKHKVRRFDRWRGVSSLACLDACAGPGGLPLGSATHFYLILLYSLVFFLRSELPACRVSLTFIHVHTFLKIFLLSVFVSVCLSVFLVSFSIDLYAV